MSYRPVQNTIKEFLHTPLYIETETETRQVLAKPPDLDHDARMIPYYFDWAATTPMSDRAIQAYVNAAKTYRGNPSALHKDGVEAAKALAHERETSADLLSISPKQVHYTSGATESNGIVLQSLLWKRCPGRVLISAIEHDSVLQYKRILENRGFEVVFIKAPGGYISIEALKHALTDTTQMICIMLVNNVLGTVQDLEGVSRLIRSHEQQTGKSVHIHCDAVQAIGKMSCKFSSLDIDSASFSAHKFRGPKGTGILYLRSPSIEPLSRGGGQEMGIRPGTEHIAAIASMNAALFETLEQEKELLAHSYELRTQFEQIISGYEHAIRLVSPSIHGTSSIVPSIFTCVVPGLPSEVFTRIMYDKGFCISSGSACSNNAPKGSSGVLSEAGISSTDADSAIRISFGKETTSEQVQLLAETLIQESKKLKSIIRK